MPTFSYLYCLLKYKGFYANLVFFKYLFDILKANQDVYELISRQYVEIFILYSYRSEKLTSDNTQIFRLFVVLHFFLRYCVFI